MSLFDWSIEEIAAEMFGLQLPCRRVELKVAYRRLAKETHPDLGGDADEFKAVQKAYELLLAAPDVFADAPRPRFSNCPICRGLGFAKFFDDRWTPFRPCFVCFACRSTLGCQRCARYGFKVERSTHRKEVRCWRCRSTGVVRTATLPLDPTRLLQ